MLRKHIERPAQPGPVRSVIAGGPLPRVTEASKGRPRPRTDGPCRPTSRAQHRLLAGRRKDLPERAPAGIDAPRLDAGHSGGGDAGNLGQGPNRQARSRPGAPDRFPRLLHRVTILGHTAVEHGRHAVLPISPVLLTRSQEYVQGLTDYRYSGAAASAQGQQGLSQWLRVFLQAVAIAVTQAEEFAASLEKLRLRWEQDLAPKRREQNLRATPRADSATSRILATLQEHPVLTTASVMRLFDVSRPAAVTALVELASAGVLTKRRLDRRTGGYLAMDVFSLITTEERQLASTRWDTGTAKPARPTPYPADGVGPAPSGGSPDMGG